MLRKKRPLIAAFTQVDKEGTGYITKDRWCKVMENVRCFDLRGETWRGRGDRDGYEHVNRTEGSRCMYLC